LGQGPVEVKCDQDELVFQWAPAVQDEPVEYVNNLNLPNDLYSDSCSVNLSRIETENVQKYVNKFRGEAPAATQKPVEKSGFNPNSPDIVSHLLGRKILIVDDVSFNIDALKIIL